MGKGKILPLEALRGMASILVFLWHFSLAFYPVLTGLFDPTRGLIGTPFFFLLNGHGAVTFFFTLSGFVLTYRFFCDDDTEYILSGVLKRYFRLLGPVFIIVMLSFLLSKLNLYYYREAALISHSPWLADFGFSHADSSFNFSFSDAVNQGLFLSLLRGDFTFNSNLWIVRVELIGSFISFGAAPILAKVSKRQSFFLLLLLAGLLHFTEPYYFCFVLGTFLALQFSRKHFSLSNYRATAFTVIGLFLFSFLYPRGFYSGWDPGMSILPVETLAVYANTAASVLAIMVVLGNKSIHAALDSRISRILGSVSFPLYLSHPLVFFSFSSWMLINNFSMHNAFTRLAGLFFATIGATLLVSYLLYLFDRYWIRLVNTTVKRIRAV